METHTELTRGANFIVEARAVGKQIKMIGNRGRPGQQEFGETQPGADINRVGVHLRPDRVERLQPVKQRFSLGGTETARQRLVKMMVTVDQPRNYRASVYIDMAIGFPIQTAANLVRRAHRLNYVVTNQDRAI